VRRSTLPTLRLHVLFRQAWRRLAQLQAQCSTVMSIACPVSCCCGTTHRRVHPAASTAMKERLVCIWMTLEGFETLAHGVFAKVLLVATRVRGQGGGDYLTEKRFKLVVAVHSFGFS
jgi:hypothetical protein